MAPEKSIPSDEKFEPSSVGAWARWLNVHHAESPGVWLILHKQATGKGLQYSELLDTALGHGWIDGQRKAATESTYLQRFTPRSKRSIWSRINRERAVALIASGGMQPAGLQEVERAKQDGRWERAYDGQRTAVVPEDLKAALAASPKARGFFATLSSQNRYAIVFRLHTAKKPETRARRLRQFIEMLEEGRKIHPS